MGKRCAAFSSAAKSWQRDESFSRVLMVLAKSDSAATHTSSTLSVGGIILCLLRASTSFSLLIMDAWDLNTGKIMVLWRRSRQWRHGASHIQQVLQEQTSIWKAYPDKFIANVQMDFSDDSILVNPFSLVQCAKRLITPAELLTCARQRLVLTHFSTFQLHWLSVHCILDTSRKKGKIKTKTNLKRV